jgi:predicted dehydrogenase
MKTLNVGIVGFGFIGKVHAYGHMNIPFYYDMDKFQSKITHICTAHKETAQKSERIVPGARGTTDFREITENPNIDIVDIATPNNQHFEVLVSAIKNNKHIYCDKPLVVDAKEAKVIEELLPNYKGISQMTLHNRYFPVTLRAKELIEEGAIGEILEFNGCYLHSGNVDRNAPLRWKLSGSCGGGVVADLGSHIIDLMQYLMGDFKEVAATTNIAYPTRPSVEDPNKMVKVDGEDNMIVLAKLANNACGTIRASKIATGSEDELSFEIYGTKGAIKVEAMNLQNLFYYDNTSSNGVYGAKRGWLAIDCGQRYPKPAGFPTPKAVLGWTRGHIHCLYNFLDAVADNRLVRPNLADGIKLQYLLDKVKVSAQEKRWVEV